MSADDCMAKIRELFTVTDEKQRDLLLHDIAMSVSDDEDVKTLMLRMAEEHDDPSVRFVAKELLRRANKKRG